MAQYLTTNHSKNGAIKIIRVPKKTQHNIL